MPDDKDNDESPIWSRHAEWPLPIPEQITQIYNWTKQGNKTIFSTKDEPPQNLFSLRESDGAFQAEGKLTEQKAAAMVELAAAQGVNVLGTKGPISKEDQKLLWMAGNCHPK